MLHPVELENDRGDEVVYANEFLAGSDHDHALQSDRAFRAIQTPDDLAWLQSVDPDRLDDERESSRRAQAADKT